MHSYVTEEEFTSLTENLRVELAEAIHNDTCRIVNKLDAPIKVRNTFYNNVVKRTIDLIIASVAFVLLLPVNMFIAIITFFDVGHPILFKQKRIGLNGKLFNMIKFRNMTNETDENGTLLMPEDRITKWGKFVRKTSLDELLNLICVIKGDMSIIGPRPMPEKYKNRFSKNHYQRHNVRPGLECPFHNKKLASKGWQGRFENDLWYVKHVGFITDVKMFVLLVKKVLCKKEREESASGKTGEFMGYDKRGKAIDSNCIPRKYLEELMSNQHR